MKSAPSGRMGATFKANLRNISDDQLRKLVSRQVFWDVEAFPSLSGLSEDQTVFQFPVLFFFWGGGGRGTLNPKP